MATNLTADFVRATLLYDPETGVFTWRPTPLQLSREGTVAGGPSKAGWRLTLKGERHLAHRVAWLYMTGAWPQFEIDHKDTNRTNNRWGNLRDVPHAVNVQNRRKAQRNSRTGVLGVFSQTPGRFYSRIEADSHRVRKYLGTFDSAEAAHAAYVAAKRELHPGGTL